jgi:hypothetical protein
MTCHCIRKTSFCLVTVLLLGASMASAATEPPVNDNFANAIALTGGMVDVVGTTLGASLEPGEFRWADNQGGHTIWYTWMAPESGICTLSGTGPGSGLLFSIYVGAGLATATNSPRLGSLSIVAANAFSSWGEPISFSAMTGTLYRISVDGFYGEQGDVSFSVNLTPANDLYAYATPIYGDQYSIYASSRNATREDGEPSHGGQAEGRSVWWTWTAPASGPVTLACDSAGLPPVLAVYAGRGLTNPAPAKSSSGSTTAHPGRTVRRTVS